MTRRKEPWSARITGDPRMMLGRLVIPMEIESSDPEHNGRPVLGYLDLDEVADKIRKMANVAQQGKRGSSQPPAAEENQPRGAIKPDQS